MSTIPTERLVTQLATIRERLERGMDRREFLRTVTSAGYAFGIAHLLGVEDFLAAEDGEVPVVTALVRDPEDPSSVEERTRTVPAKWYAAVTKAFEVNATLARSGVTGYLGSAVVPDSYDRGGARISVEVSMDGGEIRDTVDELVDGVRIDVEAIEDVDRGGGREVLAEPRLATDVHDGLVPGGVSCETDTSKATLGPGLFHPAAEDPFFVTAHHAFDRDGEIRGSPLALPLANGNQVDLGRVRFGHRVEDVVAVSATGDYYPDSTIDAQRPLPVRGQFTRFGLADLAARDEPLEKVGARTGHTTGQIQGIDAVTCLTDDFCRRGQLRWGEESDLTDGDSGSVSFHPDPEAPDEGVLVAGLNNARTWWPGQSYVWGVAAYHLTEEYGYHF